MKKWEPGMSANAKRKLAAIVFADIAGYTDKTNRDESATLDVRGRVERLLKSSTLGHNGRIVKTLGDGAMLEFASAVEAVSCALDIQDQMEHLNRDLELAEPIQLRVGAHVGDVVEENEDLYGNTVNIAARVLSMAKPGGICITREVYVQIRPILKLQCAPVAGTTADRMPERVEVFAIVGEEAEGMTVSPRKSRLSPSLIVAASLAALAVILAAYALFRPEPPPGDNSVHRILLPDWVTPGQWFELDAGPKGQNLAVFFGNREAKSELVGNRLRVQTPADLPTAQTTISVFESGSAKPLLNQQTEVIRINSLAMNTTPPRSGGALASEAPGVDIRSMPVDTPKVESGKPLAVTSKPGTAVSKPSPATPGPTGAAPSATPTVPNVRMAPLPKVEGMKEYESMMASIGEPSFKFEKLDGPELRNLPGHLGKAMRSITLVQSGRTEEAKKTIQQVRLDLKEVDPQSAAECEAILKTAEAFMDEKGAVNLRHAGQKWAQAFAFSMNRGTRNFPGLIMIDRLIDAEKIDEARRAIELLSERKDLTEAERKSLERLRTKLKSGAKSSPPPPES